MYFLSILALFSCILVVVKGEASFDELVSTQITRTFYLTKRVAKVTMEVKIKSIKGEIHGFEYIFNLPEEQFSRVGFISAGTSSINANNFKVERIEPEKGFKIGIGDLTDFERTIFIEYHIGNPYSALPKAIRLGENQLLVFEDELKLRNKYKVTKEKLIIQFLAGTIIERIIPTYMKRQENKVVHLVSQDKENEKFLVHFSLNNHLVYFYSVSRIIEISHWGNVKVKEEYSGVNMAAQNKGEFHRKEIMILSGQGFARMRNPGTVLPQNTHLCLFVDHILPYRAVGLEYYDQIGNISYSNAWRVGNSHTMLQIQPRSPLMGGWEFDYTVEYNLPLENVVFYDQNLKLYMLNLTMMPSAKGIYSENVNTQIRFPTGSSDISIDFPANNNIPSLVKSDKLDHYFGWLDIFKPRPVLVYNMSSYYIPEQLLLNYKFQAYYRIKRILGGAGGSSEDFYMIRQINVRDWSDI
ncbi:ribophorin I [Cryptosporidium ubiquitum]|uniref:Dolichyl-diphosphooligosaccharide--protein glycosyltransferase subunit 1 n=1 Tax=Cryptosporidium ubiquitum TaxID=857276 RepID=A0A1J4MGU2_9CRYT|nr:ribophorin I [Cryptosporidium ubiquitum]OII73424.1 ribophorin I [Cryptosporidium ubiquitum]